MSDINVVTEAAMAVDTKDLQCGICFDICYPVFETNCCGYLFCETHKEEMSKCPICRENSNNTRRAASNRPGFPHNSSKDYCHPAPTLNRLVGKLLSKCKFCEEQLMVSEMAAHQKNCPHRVHTCNMCKQQGVERFFNRQELLMHMTMEHSDELLMFHNTYGNVNPGSNRANSNGPRVSSNMSLSERLNEMRNRNREQSNSRERGDELHRHVGLGNTPEPYHEHDNSRVVRQLSRRSSQHEPHNDNAVFDREEEDDVSLWELDERESIDSQRGIFNTTNASGTIFTGASGATEAAATGTSFVTVAGTEGTVAGVIVDNNDAVVGVVTSAHAVGGTSSVSATATETTSQSVEEHM